MFPLEILNKKIRKCPKCREDIMYKNEKLLQLGINRNSQCKKCAASKNIPYGIWEENSNWNRKCPTCDKIIIYTGKYAKQNVLWYEKQKHKCKKCAAIGRGSPNEITRLKISNTLKGRKIPTEIVEKIRQSLKKRFNDPEWKEKYKFLRKGENNGMYGKHHSQETRKNLSKIITIAMNSPEIKTYLNNIRKSLEFKIKCSERFKGKKRSVEHCRNLRLAHIKRIENMIGNGLPLNPKFNKDACPIIDEYGNHNGYHFQHALNGGEFYIKDLGYWVDGYDKDKNVVLEVDEPHHFDIYNRLREKDVRRQKEIEEYLKCKFIRISIPKKG